MRSGDTGPRVLAVQRMLNAHGADLEADSKFGPKTFAAAAEYYQGLGIGIIGPELPDELWQSTATALGLSLLAAVYG